MMLYMHTFCTKNKMFLIRTYSNNYKLNLNSLCLYKHNTTTTSLLFSIYQEILFVCSVLSSKFKNTRVRAMIFFPYEENFSIFI